MSTTEDNFTVELVATQYFAQGSKIQADPMIEVLWFERGQQIQDKCALEITNMVRSHTKSEYIAVVFTGLPTSAYYENGMHF